MLFLPRVTTRFDMKCPSRSQRRRDQGYIPAVTHGTKSTVSPGVHLMRKRASIGLMSLRKSRNDSCRHISRGLLYKLGVNMIPSPPGQSGKLSSVYNSLYS